MIHVDSDSSLVYLQEGKSGRTAIHYAVEARDPGLVAFLTESCRVSLTKETYAGLTPYQVSHRSRLTLV